MWFVMIARVLQNPETTNFNIIRHHHQPYVANQRINDKYQVGQWLQIDLKMYYYLLVWIKYIQGHLQPCGNYTIINTLNRNKAISYKAKHHEDNLYSLNGNNIKLNIYKLKRLVHQQLYTAGTLLVHKQHYTAGTLRLVHKQLYTLGTNAWYTNNSIQQAHSKLQKSQRNFKWEVYDG